MSTHTTAFLGAGPMAERGKPEASRSGARRSVKGIQADPLIGEACRFPGGVRLREARSARGFSVTRLAHLADVAERSIRQYEKGEADPGSTTLAALTSALRVRMEWIVTGEGTMEPDGRDAWREATVHLTPRGGADHVSEGVDLDAEAARRFEEAPEDFYVLPLLRGLAACGPGYVVRDDDIEGPAIIHRSWCPHPSRTDYVRCEGNSMEPSIPDGAIITIDRSERDPAALEGHVVALWIADREAVTIKRLFRKREGGHVAMPDNLTADSLPIELAPGDRIIGRVRTVHAELGRR